MIVYRGDDLESIRNRDRVAECINVTCHPGSHDRRVLLRMLDAVMGEREATDDENLRTWREAVDDS